MNRISGFIVEGAVNEDGNGVCFVVDPNAQLKGQGQTKDLLQEFQTFLNEDERFLGVSFIADVLDRNGSVDFTVDPFRVQETHSNYTFRLAATDRVGKVLFRKARRSSSRTPAEIISSPSANVNVGINGLATAPFRYGTFNLVWVGNEVIRIGNFSTEVTPGVYSNVDRGWAGTQSERHAKGSYVFLDVPFWLGRNVRVFDWSPDRLEPFALRDVGRIGGSFVQDNGDVIVTVRSHLSDLDSATVNNAPFRLPGPPRGETGVYYVNALGERAILSGQAWNPVVDDLETGDWGWRVAKPRRSDGSPNWSPVWLQNGQHCQHYFIRTGVERQIGKPFYAESTDNEGLLGCDLATPEGVENATIDPVPLLVIINPSYLRWQADIEGTIFVPFRNPTDLFNELTVNSDIRFSYQCHPVAIAAALMLSGPERVAKPDEFDVLDGNWGLNLRRAFSDDSIARTHELIRRTQWAQVDFLALGANGQPVRIMDVIRNLLASYGFRLSIDNEGYVSFQWTGLLTVDELVQGQANSVKPLPAELLEWQDGNGDLNTSVSGQYRITPFSDGVPFNVSSVPDGRLPSNAVQAGNELQLTVRTVDSLPSLRALVESLALLQDFQCPRFRFRAPDRLDFDSDYALGAPVRLEDPGLLKPWFWTSTGQRVNPTLDPRWVGRIIGRRWLPSDGCYELEVIFPNDGIARWRGPSAQCSAENPGGADRIPIRRGSAFGSLTPDILNFTVGDQVTLYSLGGDTLGGLTPLTVLEVNETDSYLRVTPNPSFSGPNLFVRLSHIRTSGTTGYRNENVLPGVDRAYAYMADAQSTLGTANEEADQYG